MTTDSVTLAGGHPTRRFGSLRADRWWAGPLATVAMLGAFAIYATWAAFQGQHYYASPYLSPFYSPVLFTQTSVPGSAPTWHALFGSWPAWWPSFLPTSPALFILIVPGAFRFTCYYYRKAYYRAFAGSPPACGVVPLAQAKPFKGETGLLLFQNLHRFVLYLAIFYIPILYADAAAAFIKEGRFGFGVGTGILLVNATLLAGYTLGCHSFRHLVGGRDDCMSCGKATVRLRMWKQATRLNAHHMGFAWASLVWVGLTDAYVRLVSMGVIRDLNTWN